MILGFFLLLLKYALFYLFFSTCNNNANNLDVDLKKDILYKIKILTCYSQTSSSNSNVYCSLKLCIYILNTSLNEIHSNFQLYMNRSIKREIENKPKWSNSSWESEKNIHKNISRGIFNDSENQDIK